MRLRFEKTLAGVLLFALTCGGCSDAVQLVRDDPDGGLVAYSFRDDRGGPALSRYRKDAFVLMERRCPSGFRIVREGETRGHTSMSGTRAGTEDEAIGRKWGIQFECKQRLSNVPQ